jgi:hypothetical protein
MEYRPNLLNTQTYLVNNLFGGLKALIEHLKHQDPNINYLKYLAVYDVMHKIETILSNRAL